MKQQLNELLDRIQSLQEPVEEEYLKARDEFHRRRAELAEEFLRYQRRNKVGLLRFLVRTRLLVALTAPLIYLGWIPFLLIDLFVTLYQTVCFPIYRIPRVRRGGLPDLRPQGPALPQPDREVQLLLLLLRQRAPPRRRPSRPPRPQHPRAPRPPT